MEFLGEDVDGAITVRNIRRETFDNPNYIASAAALNVKFNSGNKEERTDIMGNISVCFVSRKFTGLKKHEGHGGSELREKLISAHHWFLCLNRGHNARACSKMFSALCTR